MSKFQKYIIVVLSFIVVLAVAAPAYAGTIVELSQLDSWVIVHDGDVVRNGTSGTYITCALHLGSNPAVQIGDAVHTIPTSVQDTALVSYVLPNGSTAMLMGITDTSRCAATTEPAWLRTTQNKVYLPGIGH